MIEDIVKYLGSDWNRYKEVFVESLSSRVPLLDSINRYLLESLGKQLRPMLCLLSAHICSGKVNDLTCSCAAASELLHTATLLHDDVVDDSKIRRGRPTVGAMVSSTASVLVGDFWLSIAMKNIVDVGNMDIIREYRTCLEELSKGELFQMEKSFYLDTTEEDYYKIISYKTASLFHAAMLSGAYSVDASKEQIDAVGEYAIHLGLAFQIRDDILDYSPQMKTGKPSGQDITEGKITLPLLGALRNQQQKSSRKLMADFKHGRRRRVLKTVTEAGGLKYAQDALEEESRKAISALSVFEDSQAKEFLTKLALSLCNRNS
ncbi:MAG: polyprenyl synthetase family protein [Bacteroidales bacterium]|nr:polyprenyl synthetase family protein [Bacteroidales bacterium]